MRSHFNRSALVRQLGAWQATPADAPRQNVAERLGDWLNVADAVSLHDALRAIASTSTRGQTHGATGSTPSELQARLNTDYAQVRATLAQAITTRPFGPPLDAASDFPLHHQRYADQQRRMEMSIDALRAHVRQTLSHTSPRLAQLAALDAVLAQMLGGREQKLLATVPRFLKARFKELHDSQAHSPDGHWIDRFEQDFQQALLAELDLRLQAVAGMIEALGHEQAIDA